MQATLEAPPGHRRRKRADRLRRISDALIQQHRFGSRGHARGRHALYLAILLEMRVAPELIGQLRRHSLRDLRTGRWFETPIPEELPMINSTGDLILGIRRVDL